MKPLPTNTFESNNTRDYDTHHKSCQATTAITHADISRNIHDSVMPELSLPCGRSRSQLQRAADKQITQGTGFGTQLWPLSTLCPFVYEAAACSSPPRFMIARNTPLWKTNRRDRKQILHVTLKVRPPSTPPVDCRMILKNPCATNGRVSDRGANGHGSAGERGGAERQATREGPRRVGRKGGAG